MTAPRLLFAVDGLSRSLMFEGDIEVVADAVLGWGEAGRTVRIARGRKVRTVEQLFDEMAAALQFPTLSPSTPAKWWDRPPVPFHVVLQYRPDEAAAVRDRWGAAGAVISAYKV